MGGTERHLFPGNNTPGGFFSYYKEILPLDKAKRFYCLKGGPGTGKSTLMRKLGQELQQQGWEVEYLHCSSDSDSLDGVCFPGQGIAVIDGTAPHLTDPVYPGAVDKIVHLGAFWDEGRIRARRREITASQGRISAHFRDAYRYLGAAEKLYDGLLEEQAPDPNLLHYLAAKIQGEELAHKELLYRPGEKRQGGRIRNLFLSAYTPKGLVDFSQELAQQAKTLYCLKAAPGTDCTALFRSVAESALARGCDVELFYNPLKPDRQVDHLYLPGEGLAIVTVPKEPEKGSRRWQKPMEDLLQRAIGCLEAAHEEHDTLESFYIDAMDFEKLEEVRKEILQDICNSAADCI